MKRYRIWTSVDGYYRNASFQAEYYALVRSKTSGNANCVLGTNQITQNSVPNQASKSRTVPAPMASHTEDGMNSLHLTQAVNYLMNQTLRSRILTEHTKLSYVSTCLVTTGYAHICSLNFKIPRMECLRGYGRCFNEK